MLGAIAVGVDFGVAVEAFGIDRQTAGKWMTLGRRGQPCVTSAKEPGRCESASAGKPHANGECPELALFRAFRADVERARNRGEVTLAARIADHSKKDWRAAHAILRARHPERWNVATRHELSGPDGGPVELAPALTVLETKLALMEKNRRAGGEPELRVVERDDELVEPSA